MSDKTESTKDTIIYDKEKVDFAKKGAKIDEFKFYPDSPTEEIHKKRFVAKEASKFYDPCAESSRMAIRCMENNDGTFKTVCAEYFLAYRECKKEWVSIIRVIRDFLLLTNYILDEKT